MSLASGSINRRPSMATARPSNNGQAELSTSRAKNAAPLTPRAPASHTPSSPLIQRAHRLNRSSTFDPVVTPDSEHAYTKHMLCEAIDATQDPLEIRPFVDAAISSYPSSRKPEIYGDIVKQGPKLHALVSEVRQRLNTAPERAAEMDRKIVELDQAWGASDQVWLPVEFRAGKGVRDLDKLNKLLRITKLAMSNRVSLRSLWQPGGPLWESLTGNPPKFTREAAKSAIERLRQDLLRTHGVNSRASEFGSELKNLTSEAMLEDAAEAVAADNSLQQQVSPSDSNVPDPEKGRRMPRFSVDPDISLDEDIATPHKDDRDQSPATTIRSLNVVNYQDISDDEEREDRGDTQRQIVQHAAKSLLQQLQGDVCLTDDVLNLLCCFTLASHDVDPSGGSSPHLLDPLWFHTRTPPPRMPSFLLDARKQHTQIAYLPIHLDYNHWVLCRVTVDESRAAILIYDSLLRHPSKDIISRSLEQWFCQTLPSLELQINTPACSQQSDSTSCGIFVVMTLERLLTKQSVTESIQVISARQRLLRLLLSEDSRCLPLNDFHLETLSAARVLRLTLEPQWCARGILIKSTAHNTELARPIEHLLEMGGEHEPIEMTTCNDFHPSTDDSPVASTRSNRKSFDSRDSVEQPVPQGESGGTLTFSLQAQAKRKTPQEQEDMQGTGNKKLCNLDLTDLPTLSDHFLRALHGKTESAVSLSAARLRDAEMALSQAEGTLQLAKDAMQAAELLQHKRGARAARFQQWMDEAPSEEQDPDFEDAVLSATKASQAYLDQYSLRVLKRIEAAKHGLTEAAQEVEKCSSVVVERKRDLHVTQSKEEEFRTIEGAVKRLVQD